MALEEPMLCDHLYYYHRLQLDLKSYPLEDNLVGKNVVYEMQ